MRISVLKELVFASDNKACFIERERILNRLQREMVDYAGFDKYAKILSRLLSEVSTPIHDCDYFAGRVVEALPDEGMTMPNMVLKSTGHMNYDCARLLQQGLKGILADIEEIAARKGDEFSLNFAQSAAIVVEAIKAYAQRYAKAAEEKGFVEMAKALKKVPFEPADDFYSALQSLWLIHMIASCYIGSRDYGFGRFDQYMLPYYQKALANGQTEEELTELLAGFMVKANEICGRATHNFRQKPVLCQSSKQYINIGGATPNEFSRVVLNAAMRVNMAQPHITVLLKPEADAEFTEHVFKALPVLTDKMNIYNYEPIVKDLMRKGIPAEVAQEYTFSACCTFDLNYHSFRQEYFAPVPQIFVETLHKRIYESMDALLAEFKTAMTADFQIGVDGHQAGFSPERARKEFVLDGLLLTDSAKECRYPCDGNAKYGIINLFCPGVATIGDSLMVIDKLVFRDKRFTYSEFMEIVKNDFEGQESLRSEILCYTKFGNDTPTDEYTVMAANAFLAAAKAVKLKENYYLAAGFYSLERDNVWKAKVGATPDGRKAGEPFSENQSPTYGADKKGVTALLKSLSKLPFDRTVTGGLNLTFSGKLPSEILKALILSYFRMGGFHVGISVIDRETLKDAMIHPEKYKSLTVRLYGFSEYFVSLPEWQQLAVLNRTEYTV